MVALIVLILLEIVDGSIHFLQIFVCTGMGGSSCCKFSNIIFTSDS